MNTSPKYRVKWHKSVQRPNQQDLQVRDCYTDAELKILVSQLKMAGKVYRIIRLNVVELSSKDMKGVYCGSEPCTDGAEAT
jgi:hypothetical protein